MNQLDRLISSENYSEASKFVNEEMNKMRDSGQIDEKIFYELYSKRILINQKLGQNDELIIEAIRQEKYPARREFKLGVTTKLVLEFKDIFRKKSDAYVNTIHVDKYFKHTEVGLSHGFLELIGEKNINDQLPKSNSHQRGDVITVRHAKLNSPMSFHILYYKDGQSYDLAALEKGIINTLKEAEMKNLQEITMSALGYDYVSNANKEDKAQIAAQLAEVVASTLHAYFLDNKSTSLEVIGFCFVNPFSFLSFENAFQKILLLQKHVQYIQKNLNEVQKKILAAVKTQDPTYINLLKELAYSVNDSSNLLLLGETGVGKSFLAKVIHENSQRSVNKYFDFNCAIAQKELIHSQLFGSKEGSYTDSKKAIKGILEEANNSTLFLDEIGATDIDIQRRLLTFLDDRSFYRLGDNKDKIKSNARLIFGTNADLGELVSQNLMMRDFRERISEREFEIPPLRDRKADIIIIINNILEEQSLKNDYTISIDDLAVELLLNYSWSGNHRQILYYVKDVYNSCYHQGINKISKEIIESKPIRDENVSLDKLEKVLLSFLREWNAEKGKFMDDIISPVVVKLYHQNLKLNKTGADKFLGITATSGKPSAYDKFLEKYPLIPDKLKK